MGLRCPSPIAAALGLTALLSGCAHSLLYDENRDKQGQAAVKAVEEAHFTATVEAMHEAFATMATREETSARTRVEQLFEWETLRVSRARSLDSEFKDDNRDVDGLLTTVKQRLAALGLKEGSETELRRKQVLLKTDTELLAGERFTFLGSFGVAFAGCDDIFAASADPVGKKSDELSEATRKRIGPGQADVAPLQFAELTKHCRKIAEDTAARDALFGSGKSVIRDLFADVDKRTRERAAYEVARAQAQAQITAAKKAAAPAIQAATPGPDKLARVDKTAGKVQSLIDQARTINAIAGAEVLAREKLDRLEALLAAIAGTPSDGKVKLSPDDLVGVELIRSLPALADEAEKLRAEAAKPRLVPFVAAIEYQKLVLEKIDAVNAIQDRELDAITHQLQSAIDEAVALARVRQPIELHRWSGESIEQLDKRLRDTDKRTLYAALATYGDEVRQKRVEAAVWKSRALAAGYERDLMTSEYAARQWDALMDLTAKVLADYHAAGIKTSDLAEFFKALGLVTIGVGVAQ